MLDIITVGTASINKRESARCSHRRANIIAVLYPKWGTINTILRTPAMGSKVNKLTILAVFDIKTTLTVFGCYDIITRYVFRQEDVGEFFWLISRNSIQIFAEVVELRVSQTFH
jgi:hypothetical protein